MRVLYWVRNDLRLHDNPILKELTQQRCESVLPVFVWDDFFFAADRRSPIARSWTMSAVLEMKSSLESVGSGLHIVRGSSLQTLISLAKEHNLSEIWTSAETAHEETRLEEEIGKRMTLRRFHSRTLFVPTADLLKKLPFSYSRFRFKIAPGLKMPECVEAPQHLPPVPVSAPLPDWVKAEATMPPADDRSALRGLVPGEQGALKRLEDYMHLHASKYHKTRNELIGTNFSTKWSVFLANGSLSCRLAWQRIEALPESKAKESLKLELLWREYFELLALKTGAKFFSWSSFRDQPPPTLKDADGKGFLKWCAGETGCEFVDANMRELNATGYMSNRGRQVVASYLIHDIGADWRLGAHFEKMLIDHDAALNSGNWKYLSGTGTDVRPTKKEVSKQKKMYDPSGKHARHWSKKAKKK